MFPLDRTTEYHLHAGMWVICNIEIISNTHSKMRDVPIWI